MKKNLLILVSLSVISCSVKRVNPDNNLPISTTKPIENSKDFYKTINEKNNFEFLKINSRIDAKTGSFIPTLDATIYIENEKKVWINLVAVIFQAARGIATPEGIKAYEKYNKTYIDSDFSYLNNLLGINFVDYEALQNLLLGKTFIPVNDSEFELTENANGFKLESKSNQNGKLMEYKIILNYDKQNNLEYVLLSNQTNSDQLEISYSNRVNFNNESFPKNVKIIIKADKTNEILIENTKFDFSRMDVNYSVPANYTKTEIK